MEFSFELDFLWYSDTGFSVWDGEYDKLLRTPEWKENFTKVLESMGRASAKAQKLPRPITSASILLHSDQRLYIFSESKNTVNAIIKVGSKKLFIHNPMNKYLQIKPFCVLDFYVHESCQRKGIGRLLFEYMLECEKMQPCELAYDAPSEKLLGFLNKYYGLNKYNPQNCNFVIYHDYWKKTNSYKFNPIGVSKIINDIYDNQKKSLQSEIPYQSTTQIPSQSMQTTIKNSNNTVKSMSSQSQDNYTISQSDLNTNQPIIKKQIDSNQVNENGIEIESQSALDTLYNEEKPMQKQMNNYNENITIAQTIQQKHRGSNSIKDSLSFEDSDKTLKTNHPLSNTSVYQNSSFIRHNIDHSNHNKSAQSNDSNKSSHESQLERIQREIELTKKKIAESEQKIYQQQFDNRSQYHSLRQNNKKAEMIRKAYHDLK